MSDPAETTPPASPPEDPNMEIHHKPKAVHNWRELLTEIGVIVIGVAVALAAEQGVEWLRWQSEVTAARDALHGEIGANNIDFFGRRMAEEACIQRQIREAGAILDDREARRAPGSFTRFHPENGNLLVFTEWESERAAQTLTHFPRAERALMGEYYDQLQDAKGWMLDESQAWHKLSVLRHPPKDIGVTDILGLRATLENAIEDDRLIVLNAKLQLERGQQLGVPARPVDPTLVTQFCKPAP